MALTEEAYMKKKHLALAGVLLLAFGLGVKLKAKRKNIKSAEFEEEVIVVRKKMKSRRPSSVSTAKQEKAKTEMTENGPAFSISDREKFLPETRFASDEEKEQPVNTANENPYAGFSGQSAGPSATSSSTSSGKRSGSVSANPGSQNTLAFNNVTPPVSNTNTNPGTTTPNSTINDPETTSSNPPSDNSDDDPPSVCSASIGGGSFNGPVSVELTCSNTSEVKYCLSEGTCCDPETGVTYSAPITIGQPSKTFCLSYTGGSDINESIYTFNTNLPHLEVTQKKLQVQTTQLDAQMSIVSNNFGSNDHSAGLINFRQSNPQAIGLSCEEAVEYVPTGWAGTGNLIVLPETPVFPYAPTDQINIMLNLTKLIYGENYFVSYVKSNQYAEEQFACVHSKMILRDFYYFESLPIEVSDANTFLGGFSPIGPGEENITQYRGPASDVDINSFEELRSGLVSLFFDK